MSEPRNIQWSTPGLPSNPGRPREDEDNVPAIGPGHPQAQAVDMSTNVANALHAGGTVNISGGTIYSADSLNYHYHTHAAPQTPTGADARHPVARLKDFSNRYLWISHEDIASKRTPETGDLFVSEGNFQGWVETPRGVLWASGDPGAGKTFLASAMFDAVRTVVRGSPDGACTIIYLKHNDQWTIWEIVSAIIIHLVESNPLPAAVEAIRQTLDSSSLSNGKPSLTDLVTLLHTVVKIYGRCYILIDGIDEMKAEVQVDLIKIIADLEANVLLTSRVLKLVQDQLAEIAPMRPVFITVAAQPKDLELFIKETIDRNPTFARLLADAYPKETLIKKIQDNAHGMFLHAALQMEALRHCIDLEELLDLLDRFPAGIEALYADTIKRIERQAPGHALRAKTALVWLVHAIGVLSIDDLRCATATFAPEYAVQPKRMINEDILLTICCGLVTFDPKTRQARLIHATALDALRALLLDHCPKPQAMMATACMARLVELGFHESKVTRFSQLADLHASSPLLRYAHYAVATHAERGVEEDPGLLSRVDQFIRRCTSFPMPDPIWSTVHGLASIHVAAMFNQVSIIEGLSADGAGNINAKTSHDSREGLSPLALACFGGYGVLVDFLLARPTTRSNDGELTPLMCAVIGRHEGIVRRLLLHLESRREGGDDWSTRMGVNRFGRLGATALLFAAWAGQVAILQLLLGVDGIDVNRCDGAGVSPLYAASENGHANGVKLLLDAGVDVNKTDVKGISPLHTALGNRHPDVVKLLLNASGIDIHLCMPDGTSPLYIASSTGQTDMVKLLLRTDIDVNKSNVNGNSPLYVASQNGHTDVVKLLLEVSAMNVNKNNVRQASPLHIASQNGHVDVVKLLLNATGIDVNKRDTNGVSPLNIASMKGRAEVVKLFLNATGIDVNKGDTNGTSPLLVASQNNHVDVVKLLLNATGIDINKSNATGVSPLYIASENGYGDVVKLLLNTSGIDVHQCMTDGTSPLYIASLNGRAKVVKLLLRTSIDINKTATNGYSPLYAASKNGYADVVRFLLNASGINIHQCAPDGTSPLYIASSTGQTDVVRLLLRRGIDVNKSHTNGASPLYVASQIGHTDVVKLLLEASAINVNKSLTSGASPLYVASENGHADVVKLFLNATGIDVNKGDTDGASPLYIASEKGHATVVKLLLNATDIDVNKGDMDGVSPLYIASTKGHADVVKLLLNATGIDVNQGDTNGASPLFVASQRNRIEVVKLLLNATGIDINKSNATGVSPLYIASQNGYGDVVKLLLSASGIDVRCCTTDGASPLHIASYNGSTEVVKLLLSTNIDVNKSDTTGSSPLYVATEMGHIDVVKLLLNADGIDVNHRDVSQVSPLLVAARNGDKEVVKILLEAPGISLDYRDSYEDLALLEASLQGRDAVIRLLCTRAGLDPDSLDIAKRPDAFSTNTN